MNAGKGSQQDRRSRLAATLVWLKDKALTGGSETVSVAQLDRFIKAVDHPPAIHDFRAVAVIDASMVDDELAKGSEPDPVEYALVVISVPDLKKHYTALFDAIMAGADTAVAANNYGRAIGRSREVRDRLRTWIADADTRHSVATFALPEALADLAYQDGRLLDLYTSLLGELFDLLRAESLEDPRDWATLANGLSLVGDELVGRTRSDAFFYSAAAYYIGGLSASAYVTMRRADPDDWELESSAPVTTCSRGPARLVPSGWLAKAST